MIIGKADHECSKTWRCIRLAAAAVLAPRSDPAGAGSEPARQPDVKRGAVIAAQGTPAGAPACAQCHAFNGASDGSGAFPRIAGQSAYYLAEQLRDFASGVRTNAIMSPIAKALSPDDIADVAAYYAGVDAPFLPLAKRLTPRSSSAARSSPRSAAPRGGFRPATIAMGPAAPASRRRSRILRDNTPTTSPSSCEMWQRGFRKNSPDAMAVVAKKLDEQEIAAVAAYYQQVRAPLERRPRQSQ